MGKAKAKKINIRIHKSANSNDNAFYELNKYYVRFIENNLNELNISQKEKISIIDKIIKNIKHRELNRPIN